MKKAVLLSVCVLNLAFGFEYESMSRQCVKGEYKVCEKLGNLCFKNKDGNACFAFGLATKSLGETFVEYGSDGGNDVVELANEALLWGCDRLNNQPCCKFLELELLKK